MGETEVTKKQYTKENGPQSATNWSIQDLQYQGDQIFFFETKRVIAKFSTAQAKKKEVARIGIIEYERVYIPLAKSTKEYSIFTIEYILGFRQKREKESKYTLKKSIPIWSPCNIKTYNFYLPPSMVFCVNLLSIK